MTLWQDREKIVAAYEAKYGGMQKMNRIVVTALVLAAIGRISSITLAAADEKSLVRARDKLKLEKDNLAQMRTFIKTLSGVSSTSYTLINDAGNLTIIAWPDDSGNKLTEYMDSNGNLVKSIVMPPSSPEMLVTIYNLEDQSIKSESYVNTQASAGIEIIYNSDGTIREVVHDLRTGEALILNVDKVGNFISSPIYEPLGGTTLCTNTGKFEQDE